MKCRMRSSVVSRIRTRATRHGNLWTDMTVRWRRIGQDEALQPMKPEAFAISPDGRALFTVSARRPWCWNMQDVVPLLGQTILVACMAEFTVVDQTQAEPGAAPPKDHPKTPNSEPAPEWPAVETALE